MAIVLEKIYNIPSKYTDAQKEALKSLIDDFRLRMSDDDPYKNILNEQRLIYSDGTICALADSAIDDLNSGTPKSSFEITEMIRNFGRSPIVLGMMVFASLREGFLHAANQVPFNDSGLSIDLFSKFPIYQSIYGMLLNEYLSAKQQVKDAVLPLSGGLFHGISSEYGYVNTYVGGNIPY